MRIFAAVMAKILSIETSTAMCSVALASDGRNVCSRKDCTRQHASLTAVFCDEVLKEAGLKATNLDAVCISEGPGSYTGLRVGLSTAKGLCFGAGLRLLSKPTTDILAAMGAKAAPEAKAIIPMIDARRMEVYSAVYSPALEMLTPVQALVVDENTFAAQASVQPAVFIGDGALKCREVIKEGIFIEAFPDAEAMAEGAQRLYDEGAFRDVAYFEPFYLKEFVATTSKKKLF